MRVNPNWKSRKWFLALASMVYAIIAHIWPEIPQRVPEEVLLGVVGVLVAFLIVEGAADVVSRKNGENEGDKS